jgi:hypothetical protein
MVSVKMGIMDNVLRPHLEAVTEAFNRDKGRWLHMHHTMNLEQNVQVDRVKRNQAAERFREQGNQFFKVPNYNEALLMYTHSIAAAIDGPLASLAYFNRYRLDLILISSIAMFNFYIYMYNLTCCIDLQLCFK